MSSRERDVDEHYADEDTTDKKRAAVSAVMERLPKGNRLMVKEICRMCSLIVANQSVNRMSVDNLSICFAPSFLRSSDEVSHSSPRNHYSITIVMIMWLKWLVKLAT